MRNRMHAALAFCFVSAAACAAAPGADFREGWRFKREGGEWQTVSIPHDDAIRHNFDLRRYGSSCGALPYFGKAEYEKTFTVTPDEWKRLESGKDSWRLEFDGVMSGSSVAVNGKSVYSRPCGYASFVVPLDGLLKEGENALRVTIDAKSQSSRWYPGFGIYRDARLIKRPADHVVPGSVAIWTENVTADSATVKATWEMSKGGKQEKTFKVEKPELWSPETPRLYTVELGAETFRYGIRTLRFDKTEGFFLNGKHRQMRGVCLHHDLGVFGAEFEPEAARRQLSLLKEMGCDAIRTSHNFPAPGLLDLCDEMGFMVMDEAFDEWSTPKVKFGMAKVWKEWHEREIVDFVRRDRNHPCVVMWSAGNELKEDGKPELAALGAETAKELTALFHANDPEGRPVTAGHCKPQTISNGIGAATDVFGANYLPKKYAEFKGRQGIIGTETCSVVSSRGVYAFPITNKRAVPNQVPSWDLCPMHPNNYIPDVEFAAQDANPHVFGEFVWTGFDYIGEPDPWRGNARSSYFGIFDLCGFPKDRYWIYKAKWRPDEPSAHILPHWNWTEGTKVPVHVYTSGDEAELFVNGVSQGRKRKGSGEYRLKWDDVPFAPGEVSVKTWKNGATWAEDRRVTAGKFHHFEFTDKSWGDKYVFRTVRAMDEKGVFVPDAAVEVDVPMPEGCEIFGTCNGDAADLHSLRSPKVKTFSGMALVVYKRRPCCLAATFISGVNPELHTYNREGECGTGAVVPWAGSLWAISYAPHAPNGSTDKLYEIKPDFTKIVHKESIGGTPANRLIHRESNQLFIGPYAIDAKGNVRVMKPMNDDGSTNLYGRLTASARHLTDPAHKIYTMTMEEGVYEIDVNKLKVTELFRDGNIQGVGKSKLGGDLLPGYHGKGGYSGQGRLIYANNGEFSPAAKKDPTTPSGVLAEWNGRPGKENWKVVLRNQFTDVTSKGGIYGAEHPESDPLWAVGWDVKSVILMVLDGGEWHKYRLPKGSHSYDGAHGWNTEWPRIREIGEGDDFLMTMHGTFWHFPATMSAKNSAGIRPRSNYLKVVGDFCRWGDKVVLGCDDTAFSEFLNRRKAKGGVAGPGQSNSNLWFLDPKDFDTFGPAIGRGAVWQREDVKKGAVSDPYLLAGYDKRTLYVSSKTSFSFDIEVDDKGDGKWRRVDWHGASSAAGHQVVIVPLELEKGEWVRLVAKNDAKDVTAFFNYANEDKRTAKPDPIFAGIGGMTTQMGDLEAVVMCGAGDERLKLRVLDMTGNGPDPGAYYEMDADLKLKKVADCASRQAADMRKRCRVAPNRVIMDGEGVVAEKSSILIVDDNGARWRLPWSGGWWSEGGKGQTGRICREVCTERDLLNVGGTFYELPAENAGGYAKMRPIATHDNGFIYDYCTWRGLLVMTGMMRFGRPENPRIVSGDGGDSTAAVWLGVVDDLWKYGKPRGVGGPWNDTAVKAGEVSDPYLMTGFDKKQLTVSADKDARIRIQIDLTGSGTWSTLMVIEVKAGVPVVKDLSDIRAYWVRAVSDRDCTATVQFRYE